MNVFPEENRIEKNQVYEADCVDVLKRLHSESVDLIIVDPPYYHMRGEFDFVFQSVQEYPGLVFRMGGGVLPDFETDWGVLLLGKQPDDR